MMGPIRRSGLRDRSMRGTDVDPMSNVANVSDAMLVLAIAFMLALMAYWNVALPGAEQIEQDMTSADDVTTTEEVQDAGSGYEKAGTVYRDPKTGKLYMVEE